MLEFMCANVQNILCFHAAMLNAHCSHGHGRVCGCCTWYNIYNIFSTFEIYGPNAIQNKFACFMFNTRKKMRIFF